MSSTLSSVRSSPIPDLAYDSYRSLSLRDQTLIRRQIASSSASGGTHNNFNDFSAPPNGNGNGESPTGSLLQQRHPHQSQNIPVNLSTAGGGQMREKMLTTASNAPIVKRRPSSFLVSQDKAYHLDGYSGEVMAFWILLGILVVLVLGNTILTLAIFGVVRVGVGMESIEFLPRALKFFGDADLGDIYKRDGIIQGFPNKPVEISGEDGGEVHFWSHEGSQPSFSIEKGAINISQVKEFRVVDKRGREVFSTNTPNLGLPRGVQKLDVRVAKVNRITSAVNATLQLVSTTFTYLKGAEGTHIEGRQILFKADQDIFLKSVNGNIIIQGREGIYLNVHDLPLVRESGVTRKSYTYTTHGKKESQYQLCACMPEGKLYRVEIPVNNVNRPARQRVGCHTPKNPC